MSGYRLKIQTPEKIIYDSAVISITVTSENGLLTVLAGHAPMVVLLAKGPIVVRTEQETIEGMTGHGVLKVDCNEAVVMVHSFKWVNDEVAEELSEGHPVLEPVKE